MSGKILVLYFAIVGVLMALLVAGCQKPPTAPEVMPPLAIPPVPDLPVVSIEPVKILGASVRVKPTKDYMEVREAIQGCNALGYPTKFDEMIHRAWVKHNPELVHRPCLYRGVVAKESSINPDAKGSLGEVGLAQLMAIAHEDCQQRGKLHGNRSDVRYNLACGSWLLNMNYNIWTDNRTEQQRVDLMLAGYNSGAGNLIRGQKAAAKEGEYVSTFEEMLPYSPLSEVNKASVTQYK